jgi:hypothetical protein
MRPAAWAAIALLPFTGAHAGDKPSKAEVLEYSVNWPSGLSLGEARFTTQSKEPKPGEEGRQELRFDIDAAVPGFQVRDEYRSLTTAEGCSLRLEKRVQRGAKTAEETVEFDLSRGVARRETAGGGGASSITISRCAHDGLAFVQYVRRELALGRLPNPEPVILGAAYRVSLAYKATQRVTIGAESIEADVLVATIRGPQADIEVEVAFAKDEVRTPLLVRVPLEVGVFSMELVR